MAAAEQDDSLLTGLTGSGDSICRELVHPAGPHLGCNIKRLTRGVAPGSVDLKKLIRS